MVIDFAELKKLVNNAVIEHYDHALVLHEKDRDQASSGHELFGRTRFTPWQPSCENVLLDIVERLQKALPQSEVTVRGAFAGDRHELGGVARQRYLRSPHSRTTTRCTERSSPFKRST